MFVVLVENINLAIRKFEIRFNIDAFLISSDHQTTPMMNGEHHSDKSNGHLSSPKVFISLRLVLYFSKNLNSIKNPEQLRISYMLMLMMFKGRK